MATWLITICAFAAILFVFNMLMGYRKENITLTLDGRYTNLTDQANAVIKELEKRGSTVEYKGDGQYVVDGRSYVVLKRQVSMGGAPLERTVLVPQKK